jgi:hypothetical protein
MKKAIAAVTTAIFAIALAIVGIAVPASAHDPNLTGVASCDSSTGTWTVNWTYSVTNVPSGTEADSSVGSFSPAGSTFTSSDGVVQSGHLVVSATDADKASHPGVVVRKTNWSVTFTQSGIPAATKTASVTMDTHWTDNYTDVNNPISVPLSGTCNPPVKNDASAALHVTAATCSSPASLVLDSVTNATWGTPTRTTGPGSYSVTATATSGHKFDINGQVSSTEVFTGNLAQKLSSTDPTCSPAPVCIPGSAVSYTYDPTTNSGDITVAPVTGSTGVLCKSFYVTATSWKYTTNSTWPQTVDVIQKLPKISTPGTYHFVAAVTCGQGDIYADFTTQPDPTGATLTAPGTGFTENFLHSMGFTGPNPTYTQDGTSCWHPTPETGKASFQDPTCGALGTANTVTLPAVPGGIWKWSDGSDSASYAIGTGYSGAPQDGFGTYTYTLKDGDSGDGYTVTGTTAKWTPTDASTLDCNTKITPVAPTATAITTCGTDGSITIPADTTQVKYTLTGNGTSGVNTVTATPLGAVEFTAGSYPAGGWVFDLGTPSVCIVTCPAVTSGGVSTGANPNGWDFTQTRADGHNVYVAGGLQVSTDGSADTGSDGSGGTWNTDKAAGYHALSIPLSEVGTPSITLASGSTGTKPSLQLGIDRDGNGTLDGYIVSEGSIYGAGNWWTNTTGFGVASGYGYASVGTLQQYEDANPNAQIVSFGYSLGSGVQGSATITQITAGCKTYTFAASAKPGDPTVTPQVCESSTGTDVGGSITVDSEPGLVYSLTGPGTDIAVVTTTASDLAPGDYVITVAAAPGYALDLSGPTSWPLTVTIAAATGDCSQLTTGATWHTGATGTDAVCLPTGGQEGTITLTHILPDELGQVDYTVLNHNTGVTTDEGATVTSIQVDPGVYTVTGSAVKAGDGVTPTPSVYTITIGAATTDCGQLTTDAVFQAGASGTTATCTPTNGNTGTIALVHADGEAGKVDYTLQNNATGAVTDLGATATSVGVAPGQYTVTAKAVSSTDGIDSASMPASWVQPDGSVIFPAITIGAVTAACGTLLAFTGVSGMLGVTLAGGLLFLGFAAMFMRRRRGRTAE